MIDKVAEDLADAQQRERVRAAGIGSLAQKIGQWVDDADRISRLVHARYAPHPGGQRECQQTYVCAGSQAIANRLDQQVYRRVGGPVAPRIDVGTPAAMASVLNEGVYWRASI
jgi:hypothetical protein